MRENEKRVGCCNGDCAAFWRGIYVKHLGLGWNEWRYDWTSWNHEHEWNATSVNDYLASGKEPGVPKLKVNATGACPISGEFGC